MKKKLWEQIQLIQQHTLPAHNITNYLVMNKIVNTLLAVKVSHAMDHTPHERSIFLIDSIKPMRF